MNDTRKHSVNLALAPIGGLIGALSGGALWAKYIQWTGFTAGWVALAIGILTGLGVLLAGKSRRFSVSLIAALFAVAGILFGKYLDVRWNAPQAVTVAIIGDPEAVPLESGESMMSVEADKSAESTWRLMRRRMEWFDLIYYAVAAYIAFRMAHSRRLHQYFFRNG